MRHSSRPPPLPGERGFAVRQESRVNDGDRYRADAIRHKYVVATMCALEVTHGRGGRMSRVPWQESCARSIVQIADLPLFRNFSLHATDLLRQPPVNC